MTEEEAKSVNKQESAEPVANSKEAQDSVSQEKEQPSDGNKEYNFARLREKAENAEKKNTELEKQIRELKEAFEKKNASELPQEEDELSKLDPEDIITVNQATKLVAQMLEEKERSMLPDKVKRQFSDFAEIMTEENIKKLETEEPGLAQACVNAPNPWEATYKILKKFILPSKESASNRGEQKMKENLTKPQSSNSVGRKGPLNDAAKWADTSRDELYKEMMQAARRG